MAINRYVVQHFCGSQFFSLDNIYTVYIRSTKHHIMSRAAITEVRCGKFLLPGERFIYITLICDFSKAISIRRNKSIRVA